MSALKVADAEGEIARVERRSDEQRYVSIFRAGKMSRGGHEELCVLRNISTGGAMIAHNSDLAVGERIALNLRFDDQFEAQVVWVKGDRCGVKFDDEIDLPKILAGHTAGPKPRPPRLRTATEIKILAGSTEHRALLRDISQAGACLAVDERVLPRDPEFRVLLEGLGTFRAIVCWRRGGFLGVNFASTLQMWPLNDWVRSRR
ncbi:MAG TPA: PilZ domain-containing protein [Sphingomonas sp.]|nr:PilZ domain-containing protein [Sphingomonas sp.]